MERTNSSVGYHIVTHGQLTITLHDGTVKHAVPGELVITTAAAIQWSNTSKEPLRGSFSPSSSITLFCLLDCLSQLFWVALHLLYIDDLQASCRSFSLPSPAFSTARR